MQGAGFPRLLALFYSPGMNSLNSSDVAELAKFNVVILGAYAGWSTSAYPNLKSAVTALKAANPSVLVGNYSILMEAYQDGSARASKLTNSNWWLKTASAAQVYEYSGSWTVDPTVDTAPDSNGQRYPQWFASYWDTSVPMGSSGLDFWFLDTVYHLTQQQYLSGGSATGANWLINGVNQATADPTASAAMRAAQAAEWTAIEALEPQMLLMGNTDKGSLTYAEYQHKLPAALLEGVTGQTWSVDTWGGWAEMMAWYAETVADTISPNMVVMGGLPTSNTDYALFRYTLCSTLLGDGYLTWADASGYGTVPPWMDEYNVKLGTASTTAAAAQAAPYQNGVYRRDFQNGIALVNPRGNGTRTVSLGGTFYKISGTQDPVTNNGQAVTSVTLNAADGIILTR